MVKRGEIWFADLGDNVGSEPSHERPVLVMQSDQINRSDFQTVVVVGVTSNCNYAQIPGNVLIPKSEGLLPKDSVIVAAHLAAIDKSRFISKAGVLPETFLDQVAFGIGMVLELE